MLQIRETLFHEGLNNGLGVEVLEISVGLASADKDDRLTCDVSHRYGRANLGKKFFFSICFHFF